MFIACTITFAAVGFDAARAITMTIRHVPRAPEEPLGLALISKRAGAMLLHRLSYSPPDCSRSTGEVRLADK